jgi:hypothetical protein
MDIWALQTPLTANPASSRQGFTDAAAGEIERIWADKPALRNRDGSGPAWRRTFRYARLCCP